MFTECKKQMLLHTDTSGDSPALRTNKKLLIMKNVKSHSSTAVAYDTKFTDRKII